VTLKTSYFSDDSRVSNSAHHGGKCIFQFAHVGFRCTWILTKIDDGITHHLPGSVPGDVATPVSLDNWNVSRIENVGRVTPTTNGDD
jgi:hypothetical protein